MTNSSDNHRSLDAHSMAWTSLLASWMDFARAAKGWPGQDQMERARWSDAATPIIELQAVTFALAELDRVPRSERPLARDKAQMIIEAAASRLHELWGADPLPVAVLECYEDALLTLGQSVYAGVRVLVSTSETPFVMPSWNMVEAHLQDADNALLDQQSYVAIMMPGSIVMPGTPVAWWTTKRGIVIDDASESDHAIPVQVYRCMNEDGMIDHDAIYPLDVELPAGMPLLAPVIVEGERVAAYEDVSAAWAELQCQATPPGGRWPVVDHCDAADAEA